ncbi:amidase [Candidatus Poriferisodalis sp.]|uniref:amidase n=1 Tax=Candidatus Poriferisodalis sp. TaxID=3101277 RepID=UPI003B0297ED
MNIHLSLSEAAQAVRSGAATASQLVAECLARIETTDGELHAFSAVLGNSALAAAAELDARAPIGPLHGVPIALKDLFWTEGVATEANCEALRGFVPDRDATVVTRLRAAGAVVIGKTNTHELAYGVSCPASYNPWDLSRMTGGSSGGNAAALASRQVFGALGTDTGGSVRIPSNCCGTTAVKTTRGLVPRDGVQLISWTYDTVGPMARTAADCGLLLEAIAGHSPCDPYSSRTLLKNARPVGSLRLGIPDETFYEGFDTDPDVRAALEDALEVLTGVVGSAGSVTAPNTADHFEAGATIVFAESAALLAELRETAEHLIGPAPRAILADGAAISATAFAAAQDRRRQVEAAWLGVFEDQGADLVIAPVNPNLPLPHGATEIDGVPLIPAITQFTFPVNGTGLPAIALPGGFSRDGLPVGFQLIGRPFSERTLVAVGDAFQQRTGHHLAVPPHPAPLPGPDC